VVTAIGNAAGVVELKDWFNWKSDVAQAEADRLAYRRTRRTNFGRR
jgi:hypothetical protein